MSRPGVGSEWAAQDARQPYEWKVSTAAAAAAAEPAGPTVAPTAPS
jgi:hypothetical protein